MFSQRSKSRSSFNRSSMMAANRRKRMRANMHKKVLWRQRTFSLREFAMLEDNH
ncbi:hypothetical protein [Veronia nyctiphanis]|uniref:hypothetical protein n=1 Tax=Veronia nyctiphanis TaxID=1278244 RepID=UPI00191C061A|nr:hypothetical protein [Veronia nyctiphanis]